MISKDLYNKKNLLIPLFIFINIIAFVILLSIQFIRNEVFIDYKTNCKKINLTNDSLGFTSPQISIVSTQGDTTLANNFQSNIPLTSKILKFHICENGYLEVDKIEIYYGNNSISFGNRDLDYSLCENCTINKQEPLIRVSSNAKDSVLDINIRSEFPATWEYIYFALRIMPYVLLFIYITLLLIIFGDYGWIFRTKYMIMLFTIAVYFYLIDNVREIFDAGPIGKNKIVGGAHYANKPVYFDLFSTIIIFGLIFMIFYVDFKFKNKRKT